MRSKKPFFLKIGNKKIFTELELGDWIVINPPGKTLSFARLASPLYENTKLEDSKTLLQDGKDTFSEDECFCIARAIGFSHGMQVRDVTQKGQESKCYELI